MISLSVLLWCGKTASAEAPPGSEPFARSSRWPASPTTPALITGETGTGKELAARLIHTLEDRPEKRDLVLLDCTTIARELSGSEFFGHERGAFTGALAGREGAFALADGGTLFLDEVGELPLALQAELLRLVQEHTYKRVGSNVWQRTNFRLVCATNRELLREETLGQFRRDLYYRIAGWTCRLPPLRERTGDILLLAEHFMRQLRPDGEAPELDDSVREYLLSRAYSGNVRDLRHLVARIISRHVGPGPITVGDIPEEDRPPADSGPIDWSDKSFEYSIGRAPGPGRATEGDRPRRGGCRGAPVCERGGGQLAACCTPPRGH